MEWKKNILIGLLLVCVGALLGTIVTKSCSTPQIQQIEILRTDTLVVERIDTVIIEKPVPYKVTITDTIYVNGNLNGNLGNLDGNLQGGYLFVQEVKEYGDSTYYARISGINAYLEEIRVYPKGTIKYITTIEKVYQKPKKWGLGISAGYCFTNNSFKPYVGVGVTYDLIQW